MSTVELQIGAEVEGMVTYWSAERRFGFVRVGGRDVFVGGRALRNAENLRRGARVRFEVRMDSRNRLAGDHVEIIDNANAMTSCPGCGRPFVATREHQRHCRPSCAARRQRDEPGPGLFDARCETAGPGAGVSSPLRM